MIKYRHVYVIPRKSVQEQVLPVVHVEEVIVDEADHDGDGYMVYLHDDYDLKVLLTFPSNGPQEAHLLSGFTVLGVVRWDDQGEHAELCSQVYDAVERYEGRL